MEDIMNFNIVEKLLGLSLVGAEWVLWLLIILSIISVAIMIERIFFYRAIQVDFLSFNIQLKKYLSAKEYSKAVTLCKEGRSLEENVALVGIEQIQQHKKNIEGVMENYILSQKQKLEKGLVVLGTLGNNAPFIGLFGTVIGIIFI